MTAGRGDDDPGVLGWVGVALVTASAAVAAWLEALLVPLYFGRTATVVPVAVVFALASNWYLPRLARSLVPRTVAAVLPFLAWLAVIFLLAAGARPEGDVILPGGGAVEYVGYGVMFGGALVGVLSIVFSAPPPQPRSPGPRPQPPRPKPSQPSGSSR